MNCERFLTIAADLARNQMMDAGDLTRAQVHLTECDSCGRSWNEQLALSDTLRQVAEPTKFARPPARLEAQLLAAFRARNVVVGRRPASRWPYWMSAAAAIVLMVFGLLAWRLHVAASRQSQVQVNSNSAIAPLSDSPHQEQSQTVAATGNPSSTQQLIKPVVRKSLARRHPASSQLPKSDSAKQPPVEQASVPATNVETKELATDFVLVGSGNALDLQDGGQLVRVELPRSALTKFGLPMNMDRADERIKADVLVGTDGLARAIRFVEVKAIRN